jgi:flagellar biosynthesis protein
VPERKPERPLRAAALRYEEGTTPRVVAVGRGEVARRIIEEARAAGVPVRDDAALAEALAALELDTEVPEELWAAVAEALVWAYRMDLGALRQARRD